jgi:hypothetical protein
MRSFLAVCLLALALPGVAALPLSPSPHTVACYFDGNGDGAKNANEAVFLQIKACGLGSTTAGDVRLTWSAGFSGGSLVWGGDPDAGLGTLAPPNGVAYGYFDANGDGAYGAGDGVFVHFGPLPGTVSVGDIPLTGASAFQPMSANSPGLNNPLRATPVTVGGESFMDLDGSGGYSVGDAVYLDMDANGQPTPGDLRLASGHAKGSSSGTMGQSSATTTTAPPPAQSPSPTTTAPPAPTPTATGPQSPRDTTGGRTLNIAAPSLLGLGLAFAASLAAVRRRL